MNSLKKLLPFLKDEELFNLLNKVLSSENLIYQDVKLRNILPFLDEEDLDQTFVSLLKEGREILEFLPFVSQQTLKNIVELYCLDRLDYKININQFIPYIDEDSITMLYKKLTKK